MMAITTSNSISVKAEVIRRERDIGTISSTMPGGAEARFP
jgi:hypothetical protein